jgi:hypothetical protein
VKYLCLVYAEAKTLEALSKGEFDALVDESLDYLEALRKSGHSIAWNALQPVQTAATVRVRDGKVYTTDGPFAETREQLGGFFLIEAADLNEASRLASRFPAARFGCVEVRPVRELTHS